MKFYVTLIEQTINRVIVEVDADTIQEAQEKVGFGEFDVVSSKEATAEILETSIPRLDPNGEETWY